MLLSCVSVIDKRVQLISINSISLFMPLRRGSLVVSFNIAIHDFCSFGFSVGVIDNNADHLYPLRRIWS